MKIYEALPGEHIRKTAENMVAMAKRFGCVVTAEFNEIPLDAMPNTDPSDIVKGFNDEIERRRHEYEASPEYARRQQEDKEAQEHKERALAEALAIAPEKPTVLSQEAWDDWQAKQGDPYGQAIFSYASKWARVMEARMKEVPGLTVEECAQAASSIADDEGITGFMYGAAVSILAKLWVHGEALRRWHNLKTQIRNEGEKANESGGVLNPALLRVA